MRHPLLTTLFFLSFLSLWSCQKDDEDYTEQTSPTTKEFDAWNDKFERNLLLISFYKKTNKKYLASFSDGSSIETDTEETPVFVCTPLTWPEIDIHSNNKWRINRVSTQASPSDSKVGLLAVIYDTEGLYIRTSGGKILFFHPNEVRQIGAYRFEKTFNSTLSSDLICHVDGTRISTTLPTGVSANKLVATVAYRGSQLQTNEVNQISSITPNNYSAPQTFKLTDFSGESQEITVSVSPFKNIPIIRITTANNAAITSKEDYVNAKITITDPDKFYKCPDITDLDTEIRGRGNSTWGMPKKPYKLKLNKKTSLLGMSTDKEWALLANYSDKSLMRNEIIFELSRMLKMAWTPQTRSVELYINGSYQGVYMLTEQVKVSSERVNIATVGSNDNTGDAVTGGYFLEIDERYDGVSFTTTRGLPLVFKEPKEPTDAQYNYLKEYFSQAENALYSASFTNATAGYANFLDVPSFVDNYIVQELSKNVDGNMRLSSFLSKSRNGKIMFSNVWDFDLALGNADYIDHSATGFQIKGCRWYSRLFQDPAFVAAVKAEWNRIYPQLYWLEIIAREKAAQLEQAQARNFQKWQILGQYVWPNIVWPSSYKGEVDYLVNFTNQRIQWLNQQINSW